MRSRAGLRAYVDYVVAVPVFAFAARDASALADLGDSQDCYLCGLADDVDAFQAEEFHLYEARPTVRILSLDRTGPDEYVVEAEITSPPSQRYDRNGEPRAREPEHTSAILFEIEWADGRWELTSHRAAY